MKRNLITLVAILAATILAAACAPSASGGDEASSATGSLSIQLPGTARTVLASDVDRFTVDITSTPLNYSKSLTGAPGQALSVDNLAPGSYDVLVKAYDDALPEADRLVFTGSNTAVVTAGATASVSITLVPAVGDMSVSVSFPADPSTVARQRLKGVKSDWSNEYVTYDSNGIVTRYDNYQQNTDALPYEYKLENYEVFEFSSPATRSGSKIFDKTATQIGYSTIDHDVAWNETVMTRYGMDAVRTAKITATYNAAKTAIIELKHEAFESDGTTVHWTNIRSFYDNGDLKSSECPSYVMDDMFLFKSNTDKHGVVLTYDTATRLPTRFDHYKEGTLADSETRTLSATGFYQKGEHRRVDGSLISVVTYGNPVEIDGYYAQPATRVFMGDPMNFYTGGYAPSLVYYQFFTKSFQPAGTSLSIRSFETGTVKAGIINHLWFSVFAN